ncbi:MAG: Crp/Fnr family transcriptional regulator [Anaerolineales bacterium]
MNYRDLASLPLFQGLPKKDVKRFAALADIMDIGEGEYLFGQGEPADRLFVMLEGEVEIRYNPGDGGALTVTSLERGGVFGWSAVLGRAAYTSGAICTIPGKAISVKGDRFREMCEQHPNTGVLIIERLADVIAGRLSSTREAVTQVLHNTVASGTQTGAGGKRTDGGNK